tara:strand:- start:37 stop:2346 length:2310 start_codon:yes stop_codon:yes gene_type:complete
MDYDKKDSKKCEECGKKKCVCESKPKYDYTDHQWCMDELKRSQDADFDMREDVREAHLFVTAKNGQWEPYWWEQNKDKPRYTFDLTTPIVNTIYDKIKKADFAGDVNPIGGNASKDNAEVLDGMVRNIQVISNAKHIYNSSAKSVVKGGLDGWQIVQKYIDDDSFDQDLIIENVENFVDRVWFQSSAERQDRADADYGWKFTGFTKDEYEAKWPEGGASGLSSDLVNNAYFNKPDLIMVGEYYYIKEEPRELIMMSNGSVYEDDDEYEQIKDELIEMGITEVKRRTRMKREVYVRKLDASGWLDEPKETVFSYIPLIPAYGNYEIFENKSLYHGVVQKRMDPQRVFNYSLSREIEEGALAPRAKYWMTEKQVAGNMDTIQTLNTNADPVQIFTPDERLPGPPIQNGGAQINPGLRNVSQTTSELITQTAGIFASNLGDNPNAQSGIAIKRLQDKGDAGSSEYFSSMEIAICHTMRILIKAIPKVYLGEREVRILKEDATYDMVSLNNTIIDQETGEEIIMNDLTIGNYDVTCSAGPAFQNQQEETVAAMIEIGSVDPSIIEMGSDILLNNVVAPGMAQIAQRKRQQLFQAGVIPSDQWSEEEEQKMAQIQALQAQQGPQQDPNQMIGQAELIKAQNEQAKTEISVQEKGANIQLAQQREQRENAKFQSQQRNDQVNQMITADKQQQDQMLAAEKQQNAQMTAMYDHIKTQAESMKLIREALGIDAIVSPEGVQVFQGQTEGLATSQNQLKEMTRFMYDPASGSLTQTNQ